MPQLDSSTYASQLFWLVVSFVALYFLLAKVLLPRVHSVLALRAWTIDSDIEEAGRMKSQAEQFQANYEQALTASRAESHALLAETGRAISAQAARRQTALDAVMEKKMAESEQAIRAAKEKVNDKLIPVAEELAALIVEILVHSKPSAKEVGAVISGLARERAL